MGGTRHTGHRHLKIIERMNIKRPYIYACKAFLLLLAVSACQQEQVPASLTLEFNMEPVVTRGGSDSAVTELYLEVKDGVMTPCDAPESLPVTKAGDGNVEDGGGMADLTVFLVDDNDRIVERRSISDMDGTTVRQLNFLDLEKGDYTVYAYANTVGNDWFDMPAENETSFALYKDALLKKLDNGLPVVNNSRMPLTGTLDMTLTEGNNSRKVEMLRPVGKLTMTVINEMASAVTAEDLSFGNILPSTGYVFRHDDILPEDSSSNPYHEINTGHSSHSIIPGSYHVLYESLLYEAHESEGMKITMSYEGNDYTFQENLSDRLNKIKDEKILIKLYDGNTFASDDRFLKLTKGNGLGYRLEMVDASELDDDCFWQLGSAGKQQRPLYHLGYNVYLNMDDDEISFTKTAESFKFGGSNDYSTIIKDNMMLTYDAATGNFSVSSKGTYFQFYTYTQNSLTGEFESTQIHVEDLEEDTTFPLTEIRRNQHIKLNIIFR